MALPQGIIARDQLRTNGDAAREDFTDIIYNISPTETPLHANVGRADATSDLHEWQLDRLADPDVDNAHVDGDDFAAEGSPAADQEGAGSTGVAGSTGERVGNFQQISRKDVVTSRRADITRKAGRRSELSYQIAKRGRELKRDCETIALNNQAAQHGTNTVEPRTAGVPAWLTTNTNRDAGGADGTLSGGASGQPNAAATDSGTLRALTEDALLTTVANAYIEGGDPDMVMMSPQVKQRFSNYMFGVNARIATQYQDQGKSPRGGVTVVGAVDVYVSDFGILDVVPNRFQRSRDVFVLESDMWAISYLDGYHIERMGKTGDSEKRVIIVDWGVVSRNEAANGVIADIDAALPMAAA